MNTTTRKPATVGQAVPATTWTPKLQQPQFRGTISGRTSLDPRRLTPGDQLIVDADWADLTDMLKNACEDSLLLRAQLSRRIINCRDVTTLPDDVLEHMVMIPDRLFGTTAADGLNNSYTYTHNSDAFHRRTWRYLQEQLAGNGIDVPDWPAPANQPAGRSYPAQTSPAGSTQQHHIWDMFKQLADINTTIGEVAQLICVLETTKPEQPDTETATSPSA